VFLDDEGEAHVAPLEFDPALHAALVEEIKLLYVAVTR
jgi:hypothetical protein